MTSVWGLIFLLLLFALWSWFTDLTGLSALLELFFVGLVDTAVFAAYLDLVPDMVIHSAWNFIKVILSGATFNKLWAMVAKYRFHSLCSVPGISTQGRYMWSFLLEFAVCQQIEPWSLLVSDTFHKNHQGENWKFHLTQMKFLSVWLIWSNSNLCSCWDKTQQLQGMFSGIIFN